MFLLSLLGMPPLAGFAAKFQVFRVLFDGAREFGRQGQPGLSNILYALLVIGGLNTVLSLFYYVKVLKVMILDQPLEVVESRPVAQLPTPFLANAYLGVAGRRHPGRGHFLEPAFDRELRQGREQLRPGRARPGPGSRQGGTVMDIATANVLQGIVRRESRSLLQYVGESFPWTESREIEAPAKIQELMQEEQTAAVKLGQPAGQKTPSACLPIWGLFLRASPASIIVTLAYLVPLLIDYQKQSIADLERDIVQIADEETAAEVQKILEMKRRHLQILLNMKGKIAG